MFRDILVERDILEHQRTAHILSKLERRFDSVVVIDNAENYFNRSKKPYLQKRKGTNLFIAKKRGTLVKQAPAAYGQSGAAHYYFIHAYNCIYECSYCYLQGHFHSPDMVFFINHEDIGRDISHLAAHGTKEKPIWFHAGEFSDSLALSHITGELPYYWELFSKLPGAKLEIRTKSCNIKMIEPLPALENVITSFSLAPNKQCQSYDLKAPPLKARINAMARLQALGHPLGLHFDPIIANESTLSDYQELLTQLSQHINLSKIEYLSLGVVRFTKNVYREVLRNYPDAAFHAHDLIKAQDGKVRYPRPLRMHLLKQIKNLAHAAGIAQEKIYLCMEDEDSLTESSPTTFSCSISTPC